MKNSKIKIRIVMVVALLLVGAVPNFATDINNTNQASTDFVEKDKQEN